MRLTVLLVLLALGIVAPPARAAESYDNCVGTIDSLPATITTAGVWCMKSDLATALASGAAITIASNNVTIDCSDFKLGGLAAGAATGATGIYAEGRLNAVIRNCNLRGFYTGIMFITGSGHVVEDNRLDGIRYAGMYSTADGVTIRGNQLTDVGGSALTGYAIGILVYGFSHIVDNTLMGVTGSGTSGAIGIFDGASGAVLRNRISGVMSSAGTDYAISSDANYGLIQDNYIYGSVGGTDLGIKCTSLQVVTKGNVIAEAVSGVSGCDSVGDIFKG